MKTTVKQLKNSMVELTIALEAAEQKKYRELALTQASHQIKIDGFRAGHIPLDVVEKELGEKGVMSVFLDYALSKAYAATVEAEKLQVIARPEVNITKMEPLEFTATVAVLPKVELGNYKKIKIDHKKVEVSEKEVDKVVEDLQKKVSEWKPVDRKAKMGDKVEVDFAGFTPDGVPLENTASKNHPLILGSKQFIPGFEEEVVGMKKGEEKTFPITFPKEYHAPTLAGKKVKFTVTAHAILEETLPEVNEEFVQKITGAKRSVAEMKEEIKGYLAERKSADEQVRREQEAIEALRKMAKMEIPPVLLAQEVDYLLDEAKFQVLQQGLPWEKYLEVAKKKEEDIKKEIEPEAKKRIESRLALQQMIQAEGIAIPDAEVSKVAEAEMAHQKVHHHHDGEACKNAEHHHDLEAKYAAGGQGWLQIKSRMELSKALELLLAV